MHVAEQMLDRAGAQRRGAGGLVRERRGLVRAPRGVREREPDQRVLARRELAAALDRLRRVAPGLVHERARRAIHGLDVRELLLETRAVGQGTGPAGLL